MEKIEVLCRAWIECDPNRSGNPPGSGYHADDPMPATENTVTLDEGGNITGVSVVGVSEEWQRRPRWMWFTPRAVALEDFLEGHGYVIVRADQVTETICNQCNGTGIDGHPDSNYQCDKCGGLGHAS